MTGSIERREECFNNTVPNLIRKISKVAVTLLRGRANIYIFKKVDICSEENSCHLLIIEQVLLHLGY